jgi:patatin-like phospholipase/acyl hydrolase
MEERGIRILCLDGGGVKGIASLEMLNHIMEDIRAQENIGRIPRTSSARAYVPPEEMRPCDYFDLICGTSTGGLIALMLGRLGYVCIHKLRPMLTNSLASQTVDKAIEKYNTLSKTIFGKKLPLFQRWNATYDEAALEECLKRVIRESPFGLQENALLKTTIPTADRPEVRRSGRRFQGCKTFVVSTNLDKESSRPVILRSYNIQGIKPERASSCKIWEAGRATSAAPTFFKPIVLDDQNFSDGATIANNPTYIAIMEASKIWRPVDIDCILSLGTGQEEDHTMANATLDMLGPRLTWMCERMLSRYFYFRLQLAFYSLHAMTGTEATHHNTRIMIDAYRADSETTPDNVERAEVYFRLNPDIRSVKAGLDSVGKMGKLSALAKKHMREHPDALTAREAIKLKLAGSRQLRPPPPVNVRQRFPSIVRLLRYAPRLNGDDTFIAGEPDANLTPDENADQLE